MLSKKYDSYGYNEGESFVGLAEQYGFKYAETKYTPGNALDGDSFYTENGQQLTDLVTPVFEKVSENTSDNSTSDTTTGSTSGNTSDGE